MPIHHVDKRSSAKKASSVEFDLAPYFKAANTTQIKYSDYEKECKKTHGFFGRVIGDSCYKSATDDLKLQSAKLNDNLEMLNSDEFSVVGQFECGRLSRGVPPMLGGGQNANPD